MKTSTMVAILMTIALVMAATATSPIQAMAKPLNASRSDCVETIREEDPDIRYCNVGKPGRYYFEGENWYSGEDQPICDDYNQEFVACSDDTELFSIANSTYLVCPPYSAVCGDQLINLNALEYVQYFEMESAELDHRYVCKYEFINMWDTDYFEIELDSFEGEDVSLDFFKIDEEGDILPVSQDINVTIHDSESLIALVTPGTEKYKDY